MRYTEKVTISKKMVEDFSNLIGDKNPIHLDDEYAKTTIFKRPISHGMLISSFFSKIISETYPGHGSIYISQSVNFLKPCYVGDTITIVIELISEINGKYELSTKIYNSQDVLLVDGLAIIKKNTIK